ncbi:MAG: translation elongation factor Ts [Armatimonadetes bacterium 13_1_40CM_3_65_7]|nr:MAG: translation elongation factor Ts [Armatimonadetes bacterium 13_1_40CM_3_65_7]
MEISASLVKELRARTGAGVIDCRNALAECRGDLEKAQQVLRAKGLAAAARKSGRVAKEGLVTSYIHGEGRLGVLVEINCETDFVARTQDFRTLAREIALQIAASDPRYVAREDVPADVVAAERAAYLAKARTEGKADAQAQADAERQLETFFKTAVLLEQPFIRDESRSVGDLIKETIAKTGENIQVRRFARFRLGEG